MQDDEDQLDDTVLRASLRHPGDADADPLDDTVVRPGRHRSPASSPASPSPSAPSPSAPSPSVPSPSAAVPAPALPAAPRLGPGAGTGPDLSPVASPDLGIDIPVPVPSVRVNGRVYRLDRPVVVGRRPGPPRVVQGAAPQLVTVPSPGGVVSSSHVLFHAAGSTAVVDDLRATNGTVVRAPGAPPHRMPAGASMVVLTGTVVDIGDGATIEVLSPYLRSVPPGGRESSGPLPVQPPTPGPSRTPRERP